MPVIGTNLLLAPNFLRNHWLRSMATRSFFNFELHGIDLCDAAIDQMPSALVARQPDLRIDVETKIARLSAIIKALTSTGYEFSTLREYSEQLSGNH